MINIDTSTEAVERLLDDVTPGPWAVDSGSAYCDVVTEHGVPDEDFVICEYLSKEDARFVVAARDLVPALLKERDEARAQLAASISADPVTNADSQHPEGA